VGGIICSEIFELYILPHQLCGVKAKSPFIINDSKHEWLLFNELLNLNEEQSSIYFKQLSFFQHSGVSRIDKEIKS